MLKLEPCHFCKTIPVIFECRSHDDTHKIIGYYVSCNNYNCIEFPSTDIYKTKEEAVNHWNNADRFQLKPCPFCGDNMPSIKKDEVFSDYFEVVCDNCGCKTDMFESKTDAANAWNMREEWE